MASAATSGATSNGTPTVTAASARWITSSRVMRRAQNPALWSSAHDHTAASAPASRNVAAPGSAVRASQASRATGSSPSGP